MAATVLTPIALDVNVASADLNTGTAESSTTDGYTVALASAGSERLLLYIVETAAASATVTVKAGHNPPSVLAGLGDLVVNLAASDIKVIAIESARFKAADGTINIVASATTTHVTAIVMPNGGGGGAG